MSRSQVKVAALAASAALLLAASAQAVVIQVGEATGAPGETVEVEVTLDTEGADVAGTQNDITFGNTTTSGIAIAARPNGRPNCLVNEEIDKGSTTFAYQPSGCSAVEGTCTGIRALVLSFDNVDPIPDGAVLYRCQVAIAGNASGGERVLSNTGVGASDPDGIALEATGTDGRVFVDGGDPSDATIIVGSATGNAGETVSVDILLETTVDVAGTQNDIAFAAPIAIAARPNGRPDCLVNENIDKGSTTFAYQPSGCSAAEGTCTGIRSLVLSFDNVDPIPGGSVLYTCQVRIAEDAADGTYPLPCSNPGASDPDGGALTAACTAGSIIVGEPGEVFLAAAITAEDLIIPLNDASIFPESGTVRIGAENIRYSGKDGNNLLVEERGADGTTAAPHAAGTPVELVVVTPTPTPTQISDTPTATHTIAPPTSTATRTRTPGGGGGHDDDGCAVVAPAQAGTGWLLLLPAAALLWLRRRGK